MRITIDKQSGFCFGVVKAIRKAEEVLQSEGHLYCLGDIVHNAEEVERLSRLGLESIDYDTFRSLHKTAVLLRAHGEPPETYRIARENNVEIIDASCPVVRSLQRNIRRTYEQIQAIGDGGQIVIFGKRGHAEVIGLEGQTDGNAIVVECVDDLVKVDMRLPIYLFSQTTKSVGEFRALIGEIEHRREAEGVRDVVFEWHDTICGQVRNRIDQIAQFAAQNDVVLFVGGQNSSNGKVLYLRCKEVNGNTFFLSSAKDITQEIVTAVEGAEKVGICGATSTPLWLMEDVAARLTECQGMAEG